MKNWDRDRLLMDLSRFSFQTNSKVEAEIKRYYEFYGMDFTSEFENLDQRVGWIDTPDFRMVLQTFKPEITKGTVFIFHGYFDHTGIYQHLIRFLIENGFSVAIYDMPGHGLSSGQPAAIKSFEQYQEAVDACLEVCNGNLSKPYHCVGQSTGAAVMIDRIIRSAGEEEFDKVVLLAPLVRPKGWTSIGLLHSAIKPFLKVWRRSFKVNSNDAAFVKFLKEYDPLQSKWMAVEWVGALKTWVQKIEQAEMLQRRVLIIQGTADMTVDWEYNIGVLKRLFKEVKITYVEGGMHHLVNESLDKRRSIFKVLLSELDVIPISEA